MKNKGSKEIIYIKPVILSKDKIDKKYAFKNNSEIIVKDIIEKIFKNVFITVNNKDLNTLINVSCTNYLFQEINSLISNYYICYEKENYFFSDTIFNDNYIREDASWDELNLKQPTPGKLDRWKIHRMEVVDLTNKNKSQILEMSEEKSYLFDPKNSKRLKPHKILKISKLVKKIKEDKKKEKIIEKEETEKKNDNKKLRYKDIDSFPSYPLSEDLFKINVNLTKEQEKQIEEYRAEFKLKDELKKKEKENEKKEIIENTLFQGANNNNENNSGKKMNNKYKDKTIGVTTNGEIIYIKNININDLKSEFLQINSRTKYSNNSKGNKNITVIRRRSVASLSFKKKARKSISNIEIEKNKEYDIDYEFYKANNKERLNQQMIIGGSSFPNFVPETGVNLKQSGDVKSGGYDFLSRYKRISLEQYEKALLLYNKNEIPDLKKNVIQNKNIIQKPLLKSSSLPEINSNSKTNMESSNIFNAFNNNINLNNDSNIKNSFNFTNYNNSNMVYSSKSNMNNFMKTSFSFKNIFFQEDNSPHGEESNIPTHTTQHFFKNFNPKNKIISTGIKKENKSLNEIKDFTVDILKRNNWGMVQNNQYNSYNSKKPIINLFKRNHLSKNINTNFRVRSKDKENYFRKLKAFNSLTFRSQSTENNGGIAKIVI